ncbi:MAG: CHAT domain-containing tetratricopeptide repeat protein [Terracidiphilus sp.]
MGQILNDFAGHYSTQGKYADAEPLCQRALQIDDKVLSDMAKGLSDLTALYRKQRKDAEAQPAYQQVLQVHQTAQGEVLKVMENFSQIEFALGKYTAAEALLERLLTIKEETLGPNALEVAIALDQLGEVYQQDKKFKKAEPSYQRALKIEDGIEHGLGLKLPFLRILLSKLASLYEAQDEYDKAEPLLLRALPITENASKPDDPDLASLINRLAEVYRQQEKFTLAEPLYLRSLHIYERALGPDDRNVAIELDHLSEVYVAQRRFLDQEAMLRREQPIVEKVLGADDPAYATLLGRLADICRLLGKYAEAEPLYRQAIHINEQRFGPDSVEVAGGLEGLALVYDADGNFADEAPLLERARAIAEKALGPNDPALVLFLNDLAGSYENQKRYADAEVLSRRAIKLIERVLGSQEPENGGFSSLLMTLGGIYQDEGKYSDAEAIYQRVTKTLAKVLHPDDVMFAYPLLGFAGIYDEEGKYPEAEAALERAVQILEKNQMADYFQISQFRIMLAGMYAEQGKYALAEPLFDKAFENIFQQFQYDFSFMTERKRLAFLEEVSRNFPVYFSFVYRCRQQDPALIGSMYNLLLWEKGFIAESIAGMRRRIEASGDQQAIDLLNQLGAKRTAISALINGTPKDHDQWRKQLDQLRAEADTLEKSLVAHSSTFAEKNNLDSATWQQVRDALHPGEAAVEFAHFRYIEKKKWADQYYYVALVVTPKTKDQPAYIFLGDDKQIEGKALVSIRQWLRMRDTAVMTGAPVPGTSAHDLIWKPLEPSLGNAKRIFLSSDGALNTIPLSIIPDTGGELLMERYDLRLVSSTKDILRTRTQRAARTALLIGDPAFDLTEELERAALQKLTLPEAPAKLQLAALSPNTLSRDATAVIALPRLSGSGIEVSAIAGLMRRSGWKANIYTQERALKTVVEQANSPRVVHLATHGFFLPDQQTRKNGTAPGDKQTTGMEDPMLRSGLYFAGADRTLSLHGPPQELDNGVLTAMEVANVNLNGTELVVLSACNTGQGEVKNGEGVFGLRRALQEAGAQAVLMSLWSVPDQETQELMRKFYSKWLSGREIHEALKEAEMEMREQIKRQHGQQDLPYYWGAFVLEAR